MQKPPLNPDVADRAPDDKSLTTYDEQHIITYLRLLDADSDGAKWRGWCCTLIPIKITTVRGMRSKVI